MCAPEFDEEIGTEYVWKGLGKTSINIEPHFILETPKEEINLREELLNLSTQYDIYAICDGSYVFDDGIKQTLYGEGYLIRNREIKKICDNKKEVII